MASSIDMPSRPKASRQVSRVPGGFDDADDDFSPVDAQLEQANPVQNVAESSATEQDNSIVTASSETGGIALPEEASTLEEREIRKRLMDEDSTFLPPLSPFTGSGRYDTLTSGSFRSSPDTVTEERGANEQPFDEISPKTSIQQPIRQSPKAGSSPASPQASPDTPPGMYQTPAPGREESPQESTSSSPTAQAASRRLSRPTSMTSINGIKSAKDEKQIVPPEEPKLVDGEQTPRESPSRQSTGSRPTETPTPKQMAFEDLNSGMDGDTESTDLDSMRSRKRPKYFSSRVATQTSSFSTYTTTSTQGDNDVTVGADYALQTGGAAPFGGSTSTRPRMDYSRTASLGSMASGISGLSDDGRMGPRTGMEVGMHTLSEDGPSTVNEEGSFAPKTPSIVSNSTEIPTDTVLAQRVKDVEVPASAAREYRDRHRPSSPDKRIAAPNPSISRNGRNLTLKEQSGTIDRLTKENFDLKMKITFLNDSLNKRSPEGVASLVNENADLKAAKVASAKEVRDLKRSIRDLERSLRRREAELDEISRNPVQETHQGTLEQDLSSPEMDELVFLRKRVVRYDVEIEKVRHEKYEQKRETDKLARLLDYRRNHGTDAAVQEEIVSDPRIDILLSVLLSRFKDMWKEQCNSEAARREQLEEEVQRLKDQVWQLENGHPPSNGFHERRDVEKEPDETGASEVSSRTIYDTVEQLQGENDSLRREVAAQISMLTSRNREKQILDQEIEELRLAARREGARSVVGDSGLDRLNNRFHVRPTSRASNATRTTQMSDAEREGYENKNAELRDINAALKLEIQDVTRELESCVEELEQIDSAKFDRQDMQRIHDREIAVATQDLQSLQAERDEALKLQYDIELQYQELERTAQEKITSLMQEIEDKDQDLNDFDLELKNRDDALNELNNQMRHTRENFAHLEEVMKEKEREIDELAEENQTAHDDYQKLQNQHRELVSTSDLYHVQTESHQKEIKFLREEQDGDKIKIGNLQAELTSSRDRAKELENRLAQEKHQWEVIDSKEKRELQKIMDGLNHEVSDGKAECRDLKETLQSREVEVTTYKERLLELENNLREVLGEPNGTRSSLLTVRTRLIYPSPIC